MKHIIKSTYVGMIALLSFFVLQSNSCSSDDGSKETKNDDEETTVEIEDVSGEPYDYTKTYQPERPYMHRYERTMTMKFFMASPNYEFVDGAWTSVSSNVSMKYDQALECVKAIDNISRGIPKIVYLVGWQFNGHDDRYPAFNVFNEALKRDQDASARDSYLWLQKEAHKYNTTISVHINMTDAYENSPYWPLYLKNDLICRSADGSLPYSGEYNHLKAYQVNLYNEWNKGYTQQRIKDVIEFCNLTDAKTVHIDAFFPHASPYHNVSNAQSESIIRKIIRYFRDKGVDVTCEFYRGTTRTDMYIGLQAMAWWNNLTLEQRAKIPASLAGSGVTRVGFTDATGFSETDPDKIGGFIFGDNMHAEGQTSNYSSLKKNFALQTLMYTFLNAHNLVEYDAAAQKATYSDNIVADYKSKTVTQDGNLVRDGNDVFATAVWKEGDEREIIAYSENGYTSRSWHLPAAWSDVTEVLVRHYDQTGILDSSTVEVKDGTVTFKMTPNSLASIIPN